MQTSRGDIKTKACQTGLTLVEVLVAIAILAIVLAATQRASLQLANQSNAIKKHVLADLVARNVLAHQQASKFWPNTTTLSGQMQQANWRFVWREEFSDTPNPAFRKAVIRVMDPESNGHVLRQFTGFLVQAPP